MGRPHSKHNQISKSIREFFHYLDVVMWILMSMSVNTIKRGW